MFWRLTLREIGAIMDGATAALRHRHNENAWLAWHIEGLARVDKLPRLKSLQSHVPGSGTRPAANDSKREFASWSAWVHSHQKG
ncbi:hypothetical protein EM858_04290 [Agrobacterium sp. CNPSo 2736]|uniref:hypothetical protein n=1 Tax=Agrobacterium sp. CNPSo 2736 TaxID=2499627 RepID=UPI000FD9F725|nr:hypothetical protein [Agrobacterium sp. CNPSo 2736]RVT80221.1 hypothetical protein EM858_04290 [Agrobacterium sp. CNPSo 2736]